jgi:hypothetical protein
MGARRAKRLDHRAAQMTATGRNKGGFPIQPKKILRHFAGALP